MGLDEGSEQAINSLHLYSLKEGTVDRADLMEPMDSDSFEFLCLDLAKDPGMTGVVHSFIQ